ncbi:hypothetical protein EP7_004038 [Isosphaeraceae bacterium EP7]
MISSARTQPTVMSTQSVDEASVPAELMALRERIAALPAEWTRDLQPLIDEVCDDARFRGRVLAVAKAALENLHLELSAARFDLEVTRRERDALRRGGR